VKPGEKEWYDHYRQKGILFVRFDLQCCGYCKHYERAEEVCKKRNIDFGSYDPNFYICLEFKRNEKLYG